MKLTRVRLEQVRQFRDPLEIDQLEDGLNIFTGPNESGKSTIARAIRAAFFERYRTKSVDDLIPWGDSAAAPHVELDFEIGGKPYALSKTFIKSVRCNLYAGSRVLDGEEAENHLAALLGFQFAGRGESKPEHWGIPGLLWVEQGTGQDVHAAVGHAVDHIRSVLQGALGDVASSGGDEILERISSERGLLLTGGGKPRGAYEESLKRRAALFEEIEHLDRLIEEYQQQVDRLAHLLEEHAHDEASRPWATLRAQQKQAEEARERLRSVERALEEDRRRLSQAGGTLKLLQDSLSEREARERDLQQRSSALSDLQQRLDKAKSQSEELKARKEEALATLQHAKEASRWSKNEAESVRLLDQAMELRAKKETLESQVAACEDLTRQAAGLRVTLGALQMDPKVLEELRGKKRALRENAIREEAAATLLEFDLLPGAALSLDGVVIEGRVEHRVIKASEIQIPEVGHIRVAPGGGDLEALALTRSDLEATIQGLLSRLGVRSLDEAEERFLKLQQAQSQLKELERDLVRMAPQGLDALRASLEDCSARLRILEETVGRMPALPEGTKVLSMEEAGTQLDQTQRIYDDVSEQLQKTDIRSASTLAELEAAQKEVQRLQGALSDPEEARRLQETRARLVETRAEIEVLSGQIGCQQAELEQARPDILDQDIERYRKSADLAQGKYDTRKVEIVRLQAQLQEAGAQGLEEQRGELSIQLEQEERRVAELGRRAKALDLLKDMLEAKRHALTKRLQAPLQKHLNNYLRLMFPGASIVIDDDLSPGALLRGGTTSTFDALSFGAREQMGLISRLAYADLLKEAGRPTLILLDDVLVHSDTGRLQAMKRVITDAATRHQVLLFTCHPEDWADMGVETRGLGQLKQ